MVKFFTGIVIRLSNVLSTLSPVCTGAKREAEEKISSTGNAPITYTQTVTSYLSYHNHHHHHHHY